MAFEHPPQPKLAERIATSMSISAKHMVASLVAGLAVSGCGSVEETPIADAVPAPVAAVELTTTTESPKANGEPATPELAESAQSPEPKQEFTPPFPDRLELFQPPQRAQSVARRDNEHGEMVELKGFIYVNEPRVVLSIDGVVSSLPEGGEKYGVEVISIEPPTVVLQRGRDRWPATLE
jgi:hypothetical protein